MGMPESKHVDNIDNITKTLSPTLFHQWYAYYTYPKLNLLIVLPRSLLLRLLINGIDIKHVSQTKSGDIITKILTALLAHQWYEYYTHVPN